MGMQGGFRARCGEVFPHGLGVVSAVTPMGEFGGAKDAQARDKDSGLPMWQVDVMDFDPDARERTFRVKIAAAVQPVPPEAIPGTPVRPVFLEGLIVTPWLDDRGTRPRISYSLRASALVAPRRLGEARPDTGKAA